MVSYMDGTKTSNCMEPCLNTYVCTYVSLHIIAFLLFKLKLNLLDIRLHHYGQEMDKKCVKV